MLEAINNSIAFMTEDDPRAMAHDMRLLPRAPEPLWEYDETTVASFAGGMAESQPGAQLCLRKCSCCHGPRRAEPRHVHPAVSPRSSRTRPSGDTEGAVTPEAARDLRERTGPFSGRVIVLQMR